ncbi:MAG: hypothetical protein Kow0029_07440 [Candidatus Rifleibacteriota bacterium]
MSKKHQNLVKKTGFAWQVLSTGLTGGICLGISLFLGYNFDIYFKTKPWGIMFGIFTGLASAGIQTWKQLKESMTEFEREKRERKNQKM